MYNNEKDKNPYTTRYENKDLRYLRFAENREKEKIENQKRFKKISTYGLIFGLILIVLWGFKSKKEKELENLGILTNAKVIKLILNQYRANDKANYVISNYVIEYKFNVKKDTFIGIKTIDRSLVSKDNILVNDSIIIKYNPSDPSHNKIYVGDKKH